MADLKKIETAVAELDKLFGKNSVIQLGKRSALKVDVIPTGVLSIDAALGVGGFPRGRIVEVYGPESGGKTTITLQVIAQAQAAGGAAGFIDAEHALDPKYAAALGVNVKALWCAQPDSGEQALEIAEGLIKSDQFDILVIDSVAALVPRAELDGQMGDAQMGLQARLMSQAMRKLTAAVSRARTCLVFINQVRDKIGIAYGNPEVTTGGRALKFYASQRIEVRRGSLVKDGEKVLGFMGKIKVVKNKLAAPFTEAEPEMIFGKGFSQIADLVTLGVACGIIDKAGAWFSYGGERIGQGRAQAIEFLSQNGELAQKLFNVIRGKVMPPEEK